MCRCGCGGWVQPGSTSRSLARASCSNAPMGGSRRKRSRWTVSGTAACPKRGHGTRGRRVGLGSLPLHDVALSAAELERCVRDLNLRGVIISSHVNGVELGDERLRPFWAKAEELGAVIFVHPAGNTDKRMLRNRLMITV